MLQSQYILCATLSGGIYFQEFKKLSGRKVPLFIIGILLLLLGLYYLLPMKAGAQEQDASGYRHALSGRKEAAKSSGVDGDTDGISVPDLEAVQSARATSYSVEGSTGLMVRHGSSMDATVSGASPPPESGPTVAVQREVLPTELIEDDEASVAETRRRQESAAARPSYNAHL